MEFQCHNNFSRCWPRHRMATYNSSFTFANVMHQKTWKSACISIRGWDKTTLAFRKQSAATLELYFRFWFWPYFHQWHVILHCCTVFHPNQIIPVRLRCHIGLQDGGHGVTYLLPVSGYVTSFIKECQKLSADQISMMMSNYCLHCFFYWFTVSWFSHKKSFSACIAARKAMKSEG